MAPTGVLSRIRFCRFHWRGILLCVRIARQHQNEGSS
ncbi:hypothetical protein [Cronobacter muytjensii]